MTRRQIPRPSPGSIDLTLWGQDERCLLISGPLPLLGGLIRTIRLPQAQEPANEGGSPVGGSRRNGDAA
jgi:hypothetical protein